MVFISLEGDSISSVVTKDGVTGRGMGGGMANPGGSMGVPPGGLGRMR
jgi:hypothetical protein